MAAWQPESDQPFRKWADSLTEKQADALGTLPEFEVKFVDIDSGLGSIKFVLTYRQNRTSGAHAQNSTRIHNEHRMTNRSSRNEDVRKIHASRHARLDAAPLVAPTVRGSAVRESRSAERWYPLGGWIKAEALFPANVQ